MKSFRKKTGGAVDLLHKNFDSGKCKTSLKLSMSRIKLLKNRRDQQVKVLKRDLAQLLEAGQDQTARIRVEHVIREEKTLSAYDLIELYCEIIVARLPIIESQKNCPIDLKEAISSVIFASPRCADVQELVEVRKQLQRKYGKEFVTSALELRPECGVSQLLVEKLSAKAPDIETKVKVLTAVAKEHDIQWEPKAFEEQLSKRNEELLSGPSSFVTATKTAQQLVKPEYVSQSSQNYAPATNSNYAFQSSAIPTNSRSEPKVPEHKHDETVSAYSHAKEEVSSSNQNSWGMDFKDATSAAQAAAESAERASMAARAAAEYASHVNGPRESTTHSHEYLRRTDETPSKSMSSKQREPKFEYSGQLDNERTQGTYSQNSGIKNQQRGASMQDAFIEKLEREHEDHCSDENESSGSISDNNSAEVTSADADYTFSQRRPTERNTFKQKQNKEIIRKDDDDNGSIRGRSSRSVSSSSDPVFDDGMSEVTQLDVVDTFSQRNSPERNAVKRSRHKGKVRDYQANPVFNDGMSDIITPDVFGVYSQRSPSEQNYGKQNQQKEKIRKNSFVAEEKIKELTVSPSSRSSKISFDDDRDVLHHQIDDQTSSFKDELPSRAYTGPRHDSDDDVGPGVVKGKLGEYSFKSVMSASKEDINWELQNQMDDNYFKGNFGTGHGQTGHRQDIFNDISKPLFDDDRDDDDSIDVFAEIAKSTNDDKRDDLSSDAISPPKYDYDSDGLSSDDGIETGSSGNIMKSGSVLHKQSTSVGSPSSRQGRQQSWGSNFHEKEAKVVSRDTMQSSSVLHDNHSSPRRRRRWDDSGRSSGPQFYDAASETSKVLLEEEETENRDGLLSSSLNNKESEEIELVLRLENLTGGLKNKGLPRPPYARSPLGEGSLSSKETVSDASTTIKKLDHSIKDRSFVNSEVHDQKFSNWGPHAEVFKPREAIAKSDPDDSDSEDSLSHRAPQTEGYDGGGSYALEQPREFNFKVSEKKQNAISVRKMSETDNVQSQEPPERLQADASKESVHTTPVYSLESRSRRTRPSGSLLLNKNLDDGSLTVEKASIPQRQYKSSVYVSSDEEVSGRRPRSTVKKESGFRSSISSYDLEERDLPPHIPVVTRATRGVSQRTRDASSESNASILSKARKETSAPDDLDLQRMRSTDKEEAGFRSSISSYNVDGYEERDSPSYSPAVIKPTKGASQRTRDTSLGSNISVLSQSRKETSIADSSDLQRARSTDKKETGFRSSVSSYDAGGNEDRDSPPSSPIVLRGTRASHQARDLSDKSKVSIPAEINAPITSYVQRKQYNKDEKHSDRLPQIEDLAQKESTKSPLRGSARTGASESKKSLKSSGSTHIASSLKKVDPKPSEHPSSSAPLTKNLAQEESSNSVHRTLPTDSNESSKPSASISRENSKGSSHVHPKLPDYDSLAAQFQLLRSNRRQSKS